jgi:bacillithiol biosynthesis deacetylase BshB1
MGTRGSAELRAEEAELGRQRLMARFRENLGLPDGGVDSRSREQLLAVVSALRRHRPRLVFICSEHDRHPDHVEAAHLVERACFFAGLAEHPAEGAPHRPARLAFYMGRLTFEPRFIVDITPVFKRKMQAVLAFQSQFFRTADDPRVTPISEPGFLERLAGRFRHYGGRIGTEFGEPFDMREPFGLSGVAGLFGPVSPVCAGRPAARGTQWGPAKARHEDRHHLLPLRGGRVAARLGGGWPQGEIRHPPPCGCGPS